MDNDFVVVKPCWRFSEDLKDTKLLIIAWDGDVVPKWTTDDTGQPYASLLHFGG